MRYEVVVAGKRLERLYTLGDFVLAPNTESPESATQRQAGGQYTLAEARLERDRVRGLIRQGLCPTQCLNRGRCCAAYQDISSSRLSPNIDHF